jgi:hypothetical protein
VTSNRQPAHFARVLCGKIKTTFPKRQHSLIYIKDISAVQRLCERGEMLLPNMASGFCSNDT